MKILMETRSHDVTEIKMKVVLVGYTVKVYQFDCSIQNVVN